MDAVICEHLTKQFGNFRAVDSISLSVPKGELFGLLGTNGAGKTTIIKMLTGQIKPTSGSAKVLGIDVCKNPIGVRSEAGIIPEQESPPSFLTAEEYLHFACKIRGIEGADERASKWLSMLDFEDQRDVLCKDLSRGTRQKLMFAQAFLHEPELAFIDEPMINLDPVIQKKVKDFLKSYVQLGNTVFFCTHVLEIAEEICTNIGIIDSGRLIHAGPIGELKEKKEHLEDLFLRLVRDNNA